MPNTENESTFVRTVAREIKGRIDRVAEAVSGFNWNSAEGDVLLKALTELKTNIETGIRDKRK